jgi:hypothetical protein
VKSGGGSPAQEVPAMRRNEGEEFGKRKPRERGADTKRKEIANRQNDRKINVSHCFNETKT